MRSTELYLAFGGELLNYLVFGEELLNYWVFGGELFSVYHIIFTDNTLQAEISKLHSFMSS
jgi:hypothetical protein